VCNLIIKFAHNKEKAHENLSPARIRKIQYRYPKRRVPHAHWRNMNTDKLIAIFIELQYWCTRITIRRIAIKKNYFTVFAMLDDGELFIKRQNLRLVFAISRMGDREIFFHSVKRNCSNKFRQTLFKRKHCPIKG